MRSGNQKIHGYYEMDSLTPKGASRIDKLADNISAKITTLQKLRNAIVNQSHPELKDTTSFQRELANFDVLVKEVNNISV